jgi:glycerol-3-phosphate dehydrogenase (NAD(P)+)
MYNKRENPKYLPGVRLPEQLVISTDMDEILDDSNIVVLAVPTHSVRELLVQLQDKINKNRIIVNVAKGIENNSKKRISEIVKEYFPDNDFVALSGPSHAEEVAFDIPTTVVSASRNKKVAEYIQDVFSCSTFRVYTNPDVVGVELGGALKNIIALGAGISDGLGYGDNTKAALMTRGIYEMSKLGVALGADPDTFSGLSGIGDLIVTCTSMHSRNRRAGILIGQGLSMEKAAEEIGMVVEGIKTTKSTFELAGDIGVEMPITKELYNVLYKGADVRESVGKLMGRSMKHEMEIVAKNKKTSW